jgi:dienelactone hydrolase
MKNILLIIGIFLLTSCGLSTKDLNYDVNGQNHVGFIASGAKKGEKKPGVIIVHEWWGHNEYARSRANELAKLGYVAMSIDMYGDGKVAKHPKAAGAFAKQATKDFSSAKARFEKALEILKARPDVDTTKIAAIGYCFGGGIVLNMTRAGVDLDLVASFHGSLKSPMKAKKRKSNPRVLVFNGAADPMIKPAHIKAFKKEMKKASISYELYNYEGVLHAFTNPEADYLAKKYKLPLGYDKKADEDSWAKFVEELGKL